MTETKVSQPSWRPTAKVLAGWVTGAGSTLVLGLLAASTDAIPADAAWGSFAAAVLTGAASWLQKNRTLDRVTSSDESPSRLALRRASRCAQLV